MIPPTAMQTATGPRFYLPELDGLRFIAFLLVFVHHAPYYVFSPIWRKIHEFGWMGVDLFLCLSAFLITKLLTEEFKRNSKISVRDFYFRRILRIWPLYLFMIIVGALIFTIQYGWTMRLGVRIFGLFTFTDNLISAVLGYAPIFYIVQLWTISYEQQYYAAIPWILRIFWQSTRKKMFIILTLAVLAGVIIRALFIYYQVKHPAIWVLPFTHFESILCGTLIGFGVFDEWFGGFRKSRLFYLGILCITLVYILPNVNIISWALMLTYPLLGIGMSFLIYSIIGNEQPLVRKILSHKTLVFCGKISYGLYVYHILSLYIADNLIRTTGITSKMLIIYPFGMIAVGLAITITLSIVSFYALERPFLRVKTQFTAISSRPN